MPLRKPVQARLSRSPQTARDYKLIVGGEDGRARIERFKDAAAFRKRLARLKRSTAASISMDELVALLDL